MKDLVREAYKMHLETDDEDVKLLRQIITKNANKIDINLDTMPAFIIMNSRYHGGLGRISPVTPDQVLDILDIMNPDAERCYLFTSFVTNDFFDELQYICYEKQTYHKECMHSLINEYDYFSYGNFYDCDYDHISQGYGFIDLKHKRFVSINKLLLNSNPMFKLFIFNIKEDGELEPLSSNNKQYEFDDYLIFRKGGTF